MNSLISTKIDNVEEQQYEDDSIKNWMRYLFSLPRWHSDVRIYHCCGMSIQAFAITFHELANTKMKIYNYIQARTQQQGLDPDKSIFIQSKLWCVVWIYQPIITTLNKITIDEVIADFND